MTKSEEIQILREAAAKLGSQSYCGPWLAEQIQFIESDIRSDYTPSPTLRESEERAAGIVAIARAREADIVANARRDADAIIERARAEVHVLKSQLEAVCKDVLRRL
jgi:cell division septum initiation protein DivIVA